MRIISETIQRLPYAPTTDKYGDAVKAWSSPVDVGIYAFDPGSSSEPRNPGMDRVIVSPAIYLPYGTAIEPLDRVIVHGKIYELEGEVAEWKSPHIGEIGSVAHLRRVDG